MSSSSFGDDEDATSLGGGGGVDIAMHSAVAEYLESGVVVASVVNDVGDDLAFILSRLAGTKADEKHMFVAVLQANQIEIIAVAVIMSSLKDLLAVLVLFLLLLLLLFFMLWADDDEGSP